MNTKKKWSLRTVSVLLCLTLILSYLPLSTVAAEVLTRVADPETLTRPETIYGNNTINAGKITVGKSVSTGSVTVNGHTVSLSDPDNFLVTISQSSQVMGLATQSSVPVDVVFVLDTSGSMEDNGRASEMVTAANAAIKTLLASGDENRVGVVAFSDVDSGGGTSNDAAANVLSSLAHYDGDAANNHLQWVDDDGDVSRYGDYIAGRDRITVGSGWNQRTVDAYRHGMNGGTNIQAGIIAGAEMLTSADDTTHTDPVTGKTVTRMPFLIILSDGQPTYTYSGTPWYAPSGTSQQGPGSSAYEGNGFLAALTAAYYKGKITEHYYGDSASNTNRCYVYTMGVELTGLSGDEALLAQITLDPSEYTIGDYAADGAASYWNYGNTANDGTKNPYYGWKHYWESFSKDPAADFDIRINSGSNTSVTWIGSGEPQEYYEVAHPGSEPRKPTEPSAYASDRQWQRYYEQLAQYEIRKAQYDENLKKYNEWLAWSQANFAVVSGRFYTVTDDSITAARNYVNGIGYSGGIAYNDDYYAADDVADLEKVFTDLVTTIQQKAISVPTKVTSGNHHFDGYVTFSDPIGEYMEVKDMKGVLADGYFYQGLSFAEKLSRFGTANADDRFDDVILDVLRDRMSLTDSSVDVNAFVQQAIASDHQAYYNGPNDYDNSIVWWGNIYDSGEMDEQVQVLGSADNDSIEYIEAQKAAGAVPAGADYVCRSYFFYGEAGGADTDPGHTYLYFVVRVQRELTAPYRETVVISAPASLLSMEKVLITETFDDNGNSVYTAAVEHQQPARVVYEVGLWDTITPENVSYIVSPDYATEAVNGAGSVNYDPATGTYHFFTNDWDRTETPDSHHRGMAKATFHAADDNEFYTYQRDTLLVDANGNPVTSDPTGKTAYYVREYYEWDDGSHVNGTYAATRKTTLIRVDVPDDARLIERNGNWYVPKGSYTAATLVVNGDDTLKDDPATAAEADGNKTGTSTIVAHPHRTGSSTDSHYTVFLGNNGKLSLVSDPYVPSKTVSVNPDPSATRITDDAGNPVKIGDKLTYTVEVKNVMTEAADLTVTDYVPLGTAFVPGSAGVGTSETGHTADPNLAPDANNILTWVLKDVPAGETRYVSFSVTVTETVLSLTAVPGAIANTATVQIGNTSPVVTNTVKNQPYGKTVSDAAGQITDGAGGYKVGDVLVYHIRVHNTAIDRDGKPVSADVTVTDTLPAGTDFVSSYNGGVYDAATHTVTWTFDDMASDAVEMVTVTVRINASAKTNPSGNQPADGAINVENTAEITVGNQVLVTNTVSNKVETGDVSITKTVTAGDPARSFLLNLTDATGRLEGTYVMMRNGASETITFTAGSASVTFKHGDTLLIRGLPVGTVLTVAEDLANAPGWTPSYSVPSVTVVAGSTAAVDIANTYTLRPLTLTLSGEKVLNGTLPTEATFGFIATPAANNPVVGSPLTGEVTVRENGRYTFDFSSKTFTVPGTYVYTVTEINGGVAGVTYDDTVYTLTVTVTDTGAGTMTASATLNGQTFDMAGDEITFTNTYIPEDVPLTVTGKKTLRVYNAALGRYEDAVPSAGQYRFRIVEASSGTVVSTGAVAADGTVPFNTFWLGSELLGNADSKVLTFRVSEVIPDATNDPNMLYDTRVLEFTATLSKGNDGRLSVTVGNDTDGVVDLTDLLHFTNYSNPNTVSVTPIGTKTTTNAPAGITFSFSVTNTVTGNVASAGVGDANGTIAFAPLTFNAPGTYTYWVKESNAANVTNGITYDKTVYLMKVTVTRDSYNRLVADTRYYTSAAGNTADPADYTVPAPNNSPVFTNEYNAGGYINLTARKDMTGRDALAGEFAFKLVRKSTGNVIDGILAADGETINFSTLYYSLNDLPAGQSSAVIEYEMSEVIPASAKLPGVTYDPSVHRVYVRITHAGNGVMEAELVTPDGNGGYTAVTGTDTGVVFRNSYAPVHGDSVTFTVRKTLTGRTLRAGEFDFELVHNGTVVNTAVNAADGTVTFTHALAAATKPGTYAYVIREAKGNLPGVTYSTAEYPLYIKVTDDQKGSISAEFVDASGAALPLTDGVLDLTSTAVFANTYRPRDVQIRLEAQKTLAGRDLIAKEFSFIVRQTGSAKIVATGNNDANGRIVFSTFDITVNDLGGAQQKVFTYEITESNNNVPGVTVDGRTFTVTVTVTHEDGRLTASVAYPNNAPVVFENVYTPAGTELPLKAYKTLDGKTLKDGEYVFLLKDSEGRTVQTKTNTADGIVNFDRLSFTAADLTDGNGNKVMRKEFTYTVTEERGNDPHTVYDATVYTVTVTVTDDGLGNLTAGAAYYTASGPVSVLRFVNTYTPPALVTEVEGSKIIADAAGNALTGANYPLNGFEFELRDVTGALVSTATSDASGKIVFEGLTFSAAGEYRFLATEKATAKPGYTKDITVWCIHLTVAYDASAGAFVKAAEYIHLAPESHEVQSHASADMVFVNVYTPKAVELILKVKKDLSGRDLKDREFIFRMIDDATGLRAAEGHNNAEGDVNFRLNYTKPGVYQYTVSEFKPTDGTAAGGVDYSDETYKITVTVTDDGSGALTANVSNVTFVGSQTVDMTGSVIFHNVYAADPAEVTVVARKTLRGRNQVSGEFSFRMVNLADPDDVYTAVNKADGTVTFPAVSYASAGVYQYELTETAGSAGGMTYDGKVYRVTVTVTDDGQGKLHASVAYSDAAGAVALPEFVNSYEASDVAWTAPKATKVFVGGAMRTFEFTLTADGFATQTKKNNQAGEVFFDAVTFTQPGTYVFTLRETVDGTVEDIRWDTNVYTLTVEVADDLDGKLFVKPVRITSESGRSDLVFRNVTTDQITEKEVFLKNAPTVNIDGKKLNKGDVLTYVISYTNYTGRKATVNIIDAIPAHVTYVAGSADKGGVYKDGAITWTLTDVAPDATVTVSFDVKVSDLSGTVENEAEVLEGENIYRTNVTVNTVTEDPFTKSVALASAPTVSIDGKTVKKGDQLVYTLTYTNADDFAADVTITDVIPAHTAYVAGSADEGGVYADGKIVWNLSLGAGETKTVTFKVTVTADGASIVNQATALEGENEVKTNPVTVTAPTPDPVLPENPDTSDNGNLHLWISLSLISSGAVAASVFARKRRDDAAE